jgi:S-adenosylmethionine hydrolase
MNLQYPIIALLTDFGLSDAYVGTMKGVMLSICPSARLIDLTHAIQPHNVRQGPMCVTAFRRRRFPGGGRSGVGQPRST